MIFVGEFVYGEGQKKWDKYVGEFRDGMFDGNGTYFSNDGSRYDKLLYSENDGMLISSYLSYIGEFSAGQKHGRGVMYYTNGESRQGTWSNNKLIGR